MSLLLFGEINDRMLTALATFASKDGTRSQSVILSSPGGDVGYMLGMFDIITSEDISITARGLVQSASAVLFQAGAKRTMEKNSFLRYHEPKKNEKGEFDDVDWFLFTHMIGLVKDRVQMTYIEAADLFDGKFISAERAFTLGLCDELIDARGDIVSQAGPAPESVGAWGDGRLSDITRKVPEGDGEINIGAIVAPEDDE